MAANLPWLKDHGIVVIHTPFVESDDRYKWHAKQGSDTIIRLYRLVHDPFDKTRPEARSPGTTLGLPLMRMLAGLRA
jgi:hypothetical protein